MSAVAEAEPNRFKALVYVSASEAVPTIGPRTVATPISLQGLLPSYQVKVTANGYGSSKTETGATVFQVREQGHSTLARTDDMVTTIDRLSGLAGKTAPAPAALGTK